MCTVCNAHVRTDGGKWLYWLTPLLAISHRSIFPDYHTWTLISNDRRCFYNHQRHLQSPSLCRWQERSTIFSQFLCRDYEIVRRESVDSIWSFNILTVVCDGLGIWTAHSRMPTEQYEEQDVWNYAHKLYLYVVSMVRKKDNDYCPKHN
jgi:hypothetical protein